MAKEFIVNGRKVCTVDCTIKTDVCPVVKMLMSLNKNLNESCRIVAPLWDNRSAVVRAQSTNMCALNDAIFETCIKCNIKFR